MSRPTVLIFHLPARSGDAALVRTLADVRGQLVERQAAMFRSAGAHVRVSSEWHAGLTFGELLARTAPASGGLIVLGSGAVPLLGRRDAARLVAIAAAGQRRALTNNRYSSDICAIGQAEALAALPPLPSDNTLPRWLEERAGYEVAELAGRERLSLDLDTPLDIALAALATAPAWLRRAAAAADLRVPRLEQLRALASDPHRELIVFGRSGSPVLRWLERNVRCRVRFLAEERGLRAASPLAIGGPPAAARRPPRATLGRLLDARGPDALAAVVAELGDGAVIDTRVLMADRHGADETAWPAPPDRFASDLHRADEIADPWLRQLTRAAAGAVAPIVLGAHTLVGPGVRLMLGRRPAG
ncbi:MAG TPA: hypothetical protein VNW68_01715 [Candidatus Limnocylindria bacterium]|nr:hypothetical protein [Candidatus Limnocylindria bacterium]